MHDAWHDLEDNEEMGVGLPVFSSKDAKEGPRAFMEKRKPVFIGE